LLDGILVQVPEAKLYKGYIFLKELGNVEIFSSFITLLVEIDGPDPVLVVLNVRGDIHDEIIGTHITQETYEAAFIEFYELFGQPDLIGLGIVCKIFDKQVSGYAGNMFFYQGVMVGEEGNAVRG
jgi:hypothetical protein